MKNSRIIEVAELDGNAVRVSPQMIESLDALMTDTLNQASSTQFAIHEIEGVANCYTFELEQKSIYNEKGSNPIDTISKVLINLDETLKDYKKQIEDEVQSYEPSIVHYIYLKKDEFLTSEVYKSIEDTSILRRAKNCKEFYDVYEIVKDELSKTALCKGLELTVKIGSFKDWMTIDGQPTHCISNESDEYYGNALIISKLSLECLDGLRIASTGNFAELVYA